SVLTETFSPLKPGGYQTTEGTFPFVFPPMNSTNLPILNTDRSKLAAPASSHAFRQPTYECQELADAMKLIVYVPGVDASAVEIEGRGADLTVTAKKARFVRVNFGALHLENAQRDYRLRLRLGTGFDFAAMEAE